MTRPFRRRAIAWLIALTVLFGALLPALAGAASRAPGGEVWLEICTAYGVKRVAADVESSGDASAARGEACEWCRLHGGLTALPPESRCTLQFQAPGGLAVRAYRSDPVRQVIAWLFASPRAPPAHS